MDRTEWLTARRTGIGGSDVAAVLGLSPWRTAYDLWLDKTGRAGDDAPGNAESMYWGHTLEAVVAREYMRRSGRTVQRINSMIRHPEHHWALANIDRAIVADGTRARLHNGRLLGADGILECKTASAYKSNDWHGPDGSDAMPVYYAAQVMWYLGVTGLDVADVAVLIGGQQYETRRVERDDETIRALIDRCNEFWHRHVLADVPPPPTCARDVAHMFARDDAQMIEADDDLRAAIDDLRSLRAQAGTLEQQIDALTERIKLAIGGHAGATVDGAAAVTWKAARDSETTDWRALAQSLNPPPEAVARFTVTKPGSRRFLVK